MLVFGGIFVIYFIHIYLFMTQMCLKYYGYFHASFKRLMIV